MNSVPENSAEVSQQIPTKTVLSNIVVSNLKVADSFAISFAPLSLEEIYRKVDRPENGAIVLMSGMVRNRTGGRPVIALEYQAYEPMAIEVFRLLSLEIRKKWTDVSAIAIHHRIGRLKIGEISVLVAVGCPHRTEAFEACRFAIDYLKHNAPIWKKEFWEDGSSSWVSIGACEQSGEDC
ncbi:MAG: molybdenum cofactor biosynthesis protein MoaE [Cyanobacteria bacterium P01_A01_bin.45]